MPLPTHFRIEKLTAFTAVDPVDDAEGVVGVMQGMMEVPMIGADETRIKDLRVAAQQIANATGQPIKLVQFSVRKDLETIEPEGKP